MLMKIEKEIIRIHIHGNMLRLVIITKKSHSLSSSSPNESH